MYQGDVKYFFKIVENIKADRVTSARSDCEKLFICLGNFLSQKPVPVKHRRVRLLYYLIARKASAFTAEIQFFRIYAIACEAVACFMLRNAAGTASVQICRTCSAPESAFSEPLRIKFHFFLPQDYLSDFFSSFSSSRKVSRSLNSR